MPDGSGTDEALAAFCEAEHRNLVGLLTVATADPHVGEELAQEALERLCSHWPRVQHMQNPRAWLRRVALNLAASRYRRRRAEWRANRRHGPAPDAAATDSAVEVAVRQAVAALPRRQRSVVGLRFFLGLSVAETADAMGCAPGTVKSLTNKAVGRLRAELLEPEEIST